MKYWRLIVDRSWDFSEEFDLRLKKSISAGDEPTNDVCVQTISIPSKIDFVRMRWGKPEISLSKEVIPSLTGKFEKKSDWKTRLYEGSRFVATGVCEWQIENAKFRLEEVDSIGLSKQDLSIDKEARKHWWQSVGMATGFHGAVLLLLFLLQALWGWIQPVSEEELAQKITMVEIQEIFKPDLPEPTPVVEEAEQDVPAEAKAPEKPAARAASRPAASVQKKQTETAAAASGEGQKQDLSSMGLLALQATPQSDSSRLAIDRVRVRNQSEGATQGVSLQKSSLGIEVQTGNQPVASLAGLSSGAYEAGGIGDDLKGGETANVRLVRREVEVRGGLDPALVQQIIEERLTQVRDCYESALRNNNGLQGKIDTAWTIQANGSVSNLQTTSADLSIQSLHECIRGRIGNWTFPEPRGGGVVNVKYPFVFSPLGS
jgi:hypothetical protein